MEFKQEYISEWVEYDKYEKAVKLWVEYYYDTELYDRGICSGRSERDETAIPVNSWEHGMISRNAQTLYKASLEKARNNEIDDATWKAAKNAVAKYSPAEIEKMYDTYRMK
jgi:hypothetical protein